MVLLSHKQSGRNSFRPSRLIFQDVDAAPPSPESFKGPEKQSQEDAVNEVARQTPSQIMSTAMSRGSAIKTKYVKSSQALAAVITQPVADYHPSLVNSNKTPPSENTKAA